MDRDEAIELLHGGKDGVKEWNRRRGEGEEIANLENAELIGANLAHANLENANLVGANLTHAKLVGANLDGAYIGHTSLGNIDLSTVTLPT